MSKRSDIKELKETVAKLKTEIRGDIKEVNHYGYGYGYRGRSIYYTEELPTLNAKVNAILDFLGLNVSVKEGGCTNSEIVVTPPKKPVKKVSKK